MLGTDGFGNLLPFMPIKQDWFFKYVYKVGNRIVADDFGNESQIVLIYAYDRTSSASTECSVYNDSGFGLRIDFGFVFCCSTTANDVISVNAFWPVKSNILAGNGEEQVIANIGNAKFKYAGGMLILSKS